MGKVEYDCNLVFVWVLSMLPGCPPFLNCIVCVVVW